MIVPVQIVMKKFYSKLLKWKVKIVKYSSLADNNQNICLLEVNHITNQ